MPLGPFAPQFGFPLTANGATQITGGITTVVVNYAPPTNAVAFLLQNDDSSFSILRWRLGSAANASTGHQLEAGRDSGYIPCGVTLSIFAEVGTTMSLYQLTWFTAT